MVFIPPRLAMGSTCSSRSVEGLSPRLAYMEEDLQLKNGTVTRQLQYTYQTSILLEYPRDTKTGLWLVCAVREKVLTVGLSVLILIFLVIPSFCSTFDLGINLLVPFCSLQPPNFQYEVLIFGRCCSSAHWCLSPYYHDQSCVQWCRERCWSRHPCSFIWRTHHRC